MKKLIFAVCALVLMFTITGAKAQSTSSVKPTRVYILTGCEACQSLTAMLRNAGVKLAIEKSSSNPYSAYPTVTYNDGMVDNGGRIFGGACALPKKLSVLNCAN